MRRCIYYVITRDLSRCVCQIQVQDGLTLKQALAKPMKRRELVPENCVVYKANSP